MEWVTYCLSGIAAYFLGNISFAYIVGIIAKKQDIRNFGSGNAGSTNVLRTFGKKLGFLTFFCDVLKGVLAVLLGRLIGGTVGGYIAGVCVVIGHNWPVLLGFRGGKGIAASAGVIFVLQPLGGAIIFVASVILILITKYVSLGSLFGCVGTLVISLFLAPADMGQHIVFAIFTLLAFISHRENIKRLIRGNENKLYFNKLKP